MNDSASSIASSLGLADGELYRFFFHAISRMVASGVEIPSHCGMDLIHDFIQTEWHGVRQRLDPAFSSPRPYVYAAFSLYARRQVGRYHRRRMELLGPGELDRLARSQPDGLLLLVDQEEAAEFTTALGLLRPGERVLLGDYLGHGLSERAIATRRRLSRYEVRDSLAQGFGTLARQLGHRGILESQDAAFGVALWLEGLTLPGAAAAAGLRGEAAPAKRDLLIRFYFKNFHRGWAPNESGTAYGDVIVSTHAAERIKAILLDGPFSEDILKEVRLNAPAFAAALEAEVVRFSEEQDERLQEHGDWVARVFDAMAPEMPAEERRRTDAVLQAREVDEEQVGLLFTEALLQSVPPRLRDLEFWFQDAPEVGSDEAAYLMEKPSVRAAGKSAWALASHGLTPVAVSTAAAGLASLVGRLARRELLRVEPDVVLPGTATASADGPNVIQYSQAVTEVERLTRTEAPIAGLLLRWMVAASPYVWQFFDGFRVEAASRDATAVRLLRAPEGERGRSHAERWNSAEARPSRGPSSAMKIARIGGRSAVR